ncbi:DUF397 domain-containing protein [Streptomyces sp. Ru87]|uniref:DUF397 domain-containing protein n=1 Tax=Streptomyces sp. Ru87 TaxID=2044307 RepID=UPI000BF2EF9D|nr:DUF397 domain-containing protein [Streptomyces sp. Ru87]PGH49464.1 DUF397 domain-containing protein [Streptomyces sp. Ru87]
MSEHAEWQKSSFSGGGEGNNCVELAVAGDAVAIRENDEPGVVLTTTPGPLRELIRTVKADAFRPHA